MWQLYDAGFRPNIKYGAGKLSWVSLTVNRHTFIIKSQQMIDWAIDGVIEVQDAGVFNKMHDAKTEFHYQLFRSEHRSYYGAQDLQIWDERRNVANVGGCTGSRQRASPDTTAPRPSTGATSRRSTSQRRTRAPA